jgi:hypothetical protein
MATSKSSGKSATDVVIEEKPAHGDSDSTLTVRHADDALLAELGYKSQFRREFSVRLVLSRIQ